MFQLVHALMPAVAAVAMDTVDWVVFAAAACAMPVSAWQNVRCWVRARTRKQANDWQSFWMLLVGTGCMIGIVSWYLFKFILRTSA
jgi:hypothetical protein